MKKFKSNQLVILILGFLFTACHFNYSETGVGVIMKRDKKELALVKESLRFLGENKIDSLEAIINADIRKKSTPEQMEWLLKNGKRVLRKNTYPPDTKITVNLTSQKSVTGTETYKEFILPFVNEGHPDSTMYFHITVAKGEIYGLKLSN